MPPKWRSESSTSTRLAGRQAQTRQQKLAILGFAIRHIARHNHRGNGPQPSDGRTRLVKPSHMRVAGGQKTVGHRKSRRLFQRRQQDCCRLVEPPPEEKCSAQTGVRIANASRGFQPLSCLEMLDRKIRCASEISQRGGPHPTASKARVKSKRTVHEPNGDIDRAAHRIDDAGKLHQQAVAGGLDDAAPVLGDLRLDQLAAQRFEAFERAFLVGPPSAANTPPHRRRGLRRAGGWWP
jgi:hypothetical protein